MPRLNRRQFLQTSAAIGSLLASGVGRTAGAASEHIDTPVVDRVVIREITDNQHNIFLKPLERPGLSVQRTGFPAAVARFLFDAVRMARLTGLRRGEGGAAG
jgi:hypothetical protein